MSPENSRFSALADPRFRRIKSSKTKVSVDERFKSIFDTDGDFVDQAPVDKYGRPVTKKASHDLQRFYRLESEEGFIKGADLARGETLVDSSSEEEEEDLIESDNEQENIQTMNEGEETHRVAIVNIDWDYIKTVDLYKIFEGFCPKNGYIKSIRKYISEFGKERLEKENMEGPPRNIFDVDGKVMKKSSMEKEESEEFNQRQLRKYQLDRLKYYYAVAEFDSPSTAKTVYQACDGTEYESSANVFDLRYIPNDMTFDDEPIEETAHLPTHYKPCSFVTNALQHTKVNLTWDLDDNRRSEITKKKITKEDLKNMDFSNLIGSDESDEDDADKYRRLLKGQDSEMGNMEVTFSDAEPEKKVNKKEKKKKEENSAQNDELELLMLEDDPNLAHSRHFDARVIMNEKKRKKSSETIQQEDFEVDLKDNRFNAVLESHHFAIDPTHPSFKKTKAMAKILQARREKNATSHALSESPMETSLSTLISSVKRKTNALKQ